MLRKNIFLNTLAAICCLIQFSSAQNQNINETQCSELLISKGCKNCTTDAQRGLKCTNCGPTKFFNESAQTCDSCFSGCITCSDAVSCIDCSFGYFRAEANSSLKAQGYRHTCSPCLVQNCMNCTDETTCNFCSVGYTLDIEKPGTCKYRVDEWVGQAKNVARNTLIVIVVICLLIVLGAIGWFYWEKKQERDYIDAQAKALRNREQTHDPRVQRPEGGVTDRSNKRTPREDDSPEGQQLKKRVTKPDDQIDTKPKIISLEVEKQSGGAFSKPAVTENEDEEV